MYKLSTEWLKKFKTYMTEPDLETESQHGIDYEKGILRDINQFLISMSYTKEVEDYCNEAIPPNYMIKLPLPKGERISE